MAGPKSPIKFKSKFDKNTIATTQQIKLPYGTKAKSARSWTYADLKKLKEVAEKNKTNVKIGLENIGIKKELIRTREGIWRIEHEFNLHKRHLYNFRLELNNKFILFDLPGLTHPIVMSIKTFREALLTNRKVQDNFFDSCNSKYKLSLKPKERNHLKDKLKKLFEALDIKLSDLDKKNVTTIFDKEELLNEWNGGYELKKKE